MHGGGNEGYTFSPAYQRGHEAGLAAATTYLSSDHDCEPPKAWVVGELYCRGWWAGVLRIARTVAVLHASSHGTNRDPQMRGSGLV